MVLNKFEEHINNATSVRPFRLCMYSSKLGKNQRQADITNYIPVHGLIIDPRIVNTAKQNELKVIKKVLHGVDSVLFYHIHNGIFLKTSCTN